MEKNQGQAKGAGAPTRSVTAAPRARMAVKAAWPGVSRKVSVSLLPGILTCTSARQSAPTLAVFHSKEQTVSKHSMKQPRIKKATDNR